MAIVIRCSCPNKQSRSKPKQIRQQCPTYSHLTTAFEFRYYFAGHTPWEITTLMEGICKDILCYLRPNCRVYRNKSYLATSQVSDPQLSMCHSEHFGQQCIPPSLQIKDLNKKSRLWEDASSTTKHGACFCVLWTEKSSQDYLLLTVLSTVFVFKSCHLLNRKKSIYLSNTEQNSARLYLNCWVH